ncbi:hypothetical protein ROZALSC1DRAFT_26901 [Rozella allomycis CSF55]|uniref:Uncharacterized protein n=1 Tax=Rozella allomycis (strain CSF55) TaxID=988480 RepID=A0A075AWK2_ROZAC|nr:hypothetical protein O9G_001793 [Rozella allomycis CSF55]RKP21700.1 hypothetical protein ROZALSC1DRAFT_26901 [Rozella allomycis CSF55]|eukprot:EPZ34537.1 hypothetical protein O9G_001793 [Rozella allomycis CSF55]
MDWRVEVEPRRPDIVKKIIHTLKEPLGNLNDDVLLGIATKFEAAIYNERYVHEDVERSPNDFYTPKHKFNQAQTAQMVKTEERVTNAPTQQSPALLNLSEQEKQLVIQKLEQHKSQIICLESLFKDKNIADHPNLPKLEKVRAMILKQIKMIPMNAFFLNLTTLDKLLETIKIGIRPIYEKLQELKKLNAQKVTPTPAKAAPPADITKARNVEQNANYQAQEKQRAQNLLTNVKKAFEEVRKDTEKNLFRETFEAANLYGDGQILSLLTKSMDVFNSRGPIKIKTGFTYPKMWLEREIALLISILMAITSNFIFLYNIPRRIFVTKKAIK